jgi:hypothetical protein
MPQTNTLTPNSSARFVLLAWLSCIESVLALIWLLLIPTDAENIWLLGLSRNRAILAGFSLTVCVGFASLALWLRGHPERNLDFKIITRAKETVTLCLFGASLIGMSMLSNFILSTDQSLLGPLLRLTPLLALGTLLALQFGSFAISVYSEIPFRNWFNILGLAFSLLAFFSAFVFVSKPGMSWVHVNLLQSLLIALTLGFGLSVYQFAPKEFRTWMWGNVVIGLFLLWQGAQLSAIYNSRPIIAAFFVLLIVTTVWVIFANRPIRKPIKVSLLSLLVVLLSWFIFQQANIHSIRINDDPVWSDQLSYMELMREMKDTNYAVLTRGNQAPLYPFIQSFFVEQSMNDATRFRIGKEVNIALSIVALLGLFFAFQRSLSSEWSLLLTYVAGLSIFVFKAGFYQTENLYYVLSALAFISMVRVLTGAGLKEAAWVGLWAGLAHLAKASELPAFVLFLGMLLVGGLLSLLRKDRQLLNQAIQKLLVATVAFVIVTAPYLLYNQRHFGSPFYNVNSYYMWFDGWDATKDWWNENAINNQVAHLPSNEIPGLNKYLREHSAEQVIGRIRYGFISIGRVLARPFNGFNYWLIFASLGLFIALVNLRELKKLSLRYRLLIPFSICFFAGYGALFNWFAQLASGNLNRYIYGLYIPFLFLIVYALEKWLASPKPLIAGRWQILPQTFKPMLIWFAIAMLFIDMWVVIPHQILKPDQWFGK